MKLVQNPHRAGSKLSPDVPYPSTDAARVGDLLSLCPVARQTPLCDHADLALVRNLWIKDERTRMNLGSFKALGAAYVIARQAAKVAERPDATTLSGHTYVTASAGNHGMSVAAGARIFGARSVIYIADTVPEGFARRLRDQGAEVIRQGADYAASMQAAEDRAQADGWTLLSDSSWPGYTDLPYILMEGYLQMAAEAAAQCPEPPSHILLQAGVGGMAAAVAAHARTVWGDAPQIIVVEPIAAAALQASIEAGRAVFAGGPESLMGRLDCKEPSLIALNGLARDADVFLTLSDDQVACHLPGLAKVGLATTASGAAGIAAVLDPQARGELKIDANAQVLCILSEIAE